MQTVFLDPSCLPRDGWKMKSAIYFASLLLLFLCASSGCSTSYSSLRADGGNSYELIIADEQTVLDAALEAIQNKFPGAAVSNLAGKERGYTFSTQPLLDRTTYQFTLSRASGLGLDGKPVKGYFYSVTSQGTQFFAGQRYVEPLKSEFERLLAKKGVTLLRTASMTYE